jgi:hypothetical protein
MLPGICVKTVFVEDQVFLGQVWEPSEKVQNIVFTVEGRASSRQLELTVEAKVVNK